MLIWQNVKNKTCQFHDKEFVVSKNYEQELREKAAIFREQTRTRKSIFVTMLSAFERNVK